jgi:hypothetical protein
MIRQLLRGILMLFLIHYLPAYSYADVPGGVYEIDFGQQKAVWDVSGTYHETDVSSTSDFTIVQDDKGKITGTGITTSSDFDLNVQMNFTVVGAIKAVAGTTRTDLNIKYMGTATNGIQVYNVKGNLRLSLAIDNSTNELSGIAKGSVCVVKVGCDKINDTIDLTIPGTEDGTWILTMNINGSNPKKLSGTATATLKNGRAEGFTLTGQYVPSNDMTKLTLKGSAGSFNLQTNVVGSAVSIQKMTAKLLGQDVRIP